MKPRTIIIVALIGATVFLGLGVLANVTGKALVGITLLGAILSLAEAHIQTQALSFFFQKRKESEEDEEN